MFAIRQARPDDLPAVQLLLRNCELPFEDLTERHLAHFMVLGQNKPLVGCVGIEAVGNDGLLRSLAIDPLRRGGGFGRQLLNVMEMQAQDLGISTLYLLTTTAAAFFEGQGYQRIDRISAPLALQAATQFSNLCPPASSCLFKSLA
jgi:amino-acid N-acetyltransferase